VGFVRADGRRQPDTPLADVVRHFAYLAERMGVEHVGFGSDFDGTTVPDEIGDVTGLPRLLDALRAAGFAEADLRKVASENWLRVLEQTWKQPAPGSGQRPTAIGTGTGRPPASSIRARRPSP
jgi:membrane dipeptidase